ncbi:MAG: rhomboid family intramembrane serine protease [Lentisphaeria bacterium]|nr:rhomboid family intramembrane serine protease [Lentisphaeria bacterium]
MLDDRDYMRQRPDNKTLEGRKCVLVLIAVNVAVYLFSIAQPQLAVDLLWLNPDQFRGGMFWQPLTAMFMHGGFTHILFNMWGLYIFGGIVAPRLGGKGFLALYMATGLLGNLVWLAASWNSPAILCGASGAVMAVTAAAAVMAPETPMLLFFIPFPIKLKTVAIVFFALEIVLEITNKQPGVANLVHIVGFVTGYLFIKLFFRREMLWDPLNPLVGHRGYRPSPPRNDGGSASGWTYRRSPDRDSDYGPNFSTGSDYGYNSTRVSQRELDYLLDKISRTGINSLTEQELQRLKQAREEMRRS